MRNVLITGAAGFLGSYILYELLKDKDVIPTVIIRGSGGKSVDERMESVFKYFYGDKNFGSVAKRVKIIRGEVDKKNLAIDEKSMASIINDTDEIYHSAAIAQFRIPLDTIRMSNVAGTRNVLDLAVECAKNGRLKKVNHISTTYVAGITTGAFLEDHLNMGQQFNNTYEQSKFEAELLVREYRQKGLNVNVFRPSILTGDSRNGKTSNFKMLYQPLHFFAAELFNAAPVNEETQENLVPVDSAAEAIVAIANLNEYKNMAYHIASTKTVGIGRFIDVAADYFGFHKPELIPVEDFDMNRLSAVQRNLIDPYVPYFNYKTSFDSTYTQKALKKTDVKIPDVDDTMLIALFRFCREAGFIRPARRYVAAG